MKVADRPEVVNTYRANLHGSLRMPLIVSYICRPSQALEASSAAAVCANITYQVSLSAVWVWTAIKLLPNR